MCYAEGSIEYSTSTCKMCSVLKGVYNKPAPICVHKPKMQVCRNRTNHPRADIIHYSNAEIKSFNGCGYCKWAQCHSERGQSQRDFYNNQGWPGCCRPPSPADYQQYIKPEDWIAVSFLFKLPRATASGSEIVSGSKDDSTLSAKPRRARNAGTPTSSTVAIPRASRTTTNDSGTINPSTIRSSSPNRGGRPSTPPLYSTSSPSARGSAMKLAPKASLTPPEDSPDTPPTRPSKELGSAKRQPTASAIEREITLMRYSPTEIERERERERRQTITVQKYRPVVNDDLAAPILPPSPSSRMLRAKTGSSPKVAIRTSPNALGVSTELRGAGASALSGVIGTLSRKDSPTGSGGSGSPSPVSSSVGSGGGGGGASMPMIDVVTSPNSRAPAPERAPRPANSLSSSNMGVHVNSKHQLSPLTTNLFSFAPPSAACSSSSGSSSSSTPSSGRSRDCDCRGNAGDDVAYTPRPSMSSSYPKLSPPEGGHADSEQGESYHSGSEASADTTSSRSSSSSRHSAHSASSASSVSGASTTTRGSARSRSASSSASDFTDFLSDDSEYELQRQAEERALQMQKMRVERAEEREFRDAQQALESLELTESLGMGVGPTVGGGMGMRSLGAGLVPPPMTATRYGVDGVSVIGNNGHTIVLGGRTGGGGPANEVLQGHGQTVFVGRYH